VRTSERILISTVLTVWCGVAVSSAWAQSGGGAAQATGAPQAAADNNRSVTIYFSARDLDGTIVRDLKAGELKLKVDGAPRKIDGFVVPDDAAPLTIDVLIDEPGSSAFAESDVAQSYGYSFFLYLLRRGDLADVREFEVTSQLLVSASDDPKTLADALVQEKQPYKGKAMLASLAEACQSELAGSETRRKVVLLISTGRENLSKVSQRDVESCLRKEDVVVDAVGIFDPVGVREASPEDWSGPNLLASLASHTGGHVWDPSSAAWTQVEGYARFEAVLTDVVQQIRGQYTIEFTGLAPKPDGKPHRIELTTTRKRIVLFAPQDMPDGEAVGP